MCFCPLKCPINQERGPQGMSVGQSSASCGRSSAEADVQVAKGRRGRHCLIQTLGPGGPFAKGQLPPLVIAPHLPDFLSISSSALTWNSEYSQFIPGPFSSFLWCHVSLTWPLPDPRPLPKAVEPTLEGTGIRFLMEMSRGDPNGTTVGGHTTHHGLVPI